MKTCQNMTHSCFGGEGPDMVRCLEDIPVSGEVGVSRWLLIVVVVVLVMLLLCNVSCHVIINLAMSSLSR